MNHRLFLAPLFFLGFVMLLPAFSADEKKDTPKGKDGIQPAPADCPACAMGLTADFVFKRLDVNEDKFITLAEFRRSPGMQDEKKAKDAFDRIDKNGDGKLSWEEFEAAYKARHADCKKSDPAKAADPKGKVQPDGRGDGKKFAQVFLLKFDKNGDGKIDKSEFRGSAAAFDELDKNKDGFLNLQELEVLHQRRLADPKSMKERLKSGDLPQPPDNVRPKGLGDGVKAEEKKEAKNMEFTGTLRTGIVAIGVETTGTILETKKGRFELDFGKQKELRQKAEKLNGKTVTVVGKLELRKGVEVKECRIVTVTSLEETKDK